MDLKFHVLLMSFYFSHLSRGLLLTSLLLYACFSPPAWAQPSVGRSLTLPEAVKVAIAQSKAIRVNAAEQGVAQARLQQARDKYAPAISANASYVRISNNITPFTINLPGAGDVVLNPPILDQSYNNVQVR